MLLLFSSRLTRRKVFVAPVFMLFAASLSRSRRARSLCDFVGQWEGRRLEPAELEGDRSSQADSEFDGFRIEGPGGGSAEGARFGIAGYPVGTAAPGYGRCGGAWGSRWPWRAAAGTGSGALCPPALARGHLAPHTPVTLMSRVCK